MVRRGTSIQVQNTLTAKYAGIQGMYFGALAPIGAFASVFLLYKGFTNSQIGTLISLGSIGSVILQLVIGNLADRYRIFSIRAMTAAFSIMVITLSLMLCIIPSGRLMTAINYVAIMVVTFAMTPLISSMNFLYQKWGITVNYGVARAAGSIMYAVLTAVIGRVAAHFSADIIPWFNILTFAGILFFVATYRLPKNAAHSDTVVTAKEVVQAVRMSDFIRRNSSFMIFLVGVSMIFLNHSSLQTYLLQIIMTKGGDSASLGMTASIGAVLEVPMMVGFARLSRKVNCSRLIQISILFFTLKAIGFLLVPDMTGVYLMQVLNLFGYALFTPASVYYVAQIMEERDKVKGQAYLASATAISGICANFAGGRILDAYGADKMMQCVIALSIAGTVLVIMAVRAMGRKRDEECS